MRHSFLIILVVSLIAGCAHKEPAPTENSASAGIDIDLPGFMRLNIDDIYQMKSAVANARHKILRLSDNQEAQCKEQSCSFKSSKANGTLRGVDLDRLSTTIKKAQKTKKEETYKDGPVTLRCIPEQCSVDLKIDDHTPRKYSTDPSITTRSDYSGYFLGDFIGGLVSSATAPKP